MGLFSRKPKSEYLEEIYEINGFIIGKESNTIYHIPIVDAERTCILPSGTMGLSQTALSEICFGEIEELVVPGSFKKFNYMGPARTKIKRIVLQEGIEECNSYFGVNIDYELPSTIKKLGAGKNYTINKDLILPNGVVEIEDFFASHDNNLVSVTIPGTLTVIPTCAFNQCNNLQTAILGEGVMEIGDDAFRGTNDLRNISLPSTFNGNIAFSMEPRPTPVTRGNLDLKENSNYEKTINNTLSIKIRRGDKELEFRVRRGDDPVFYASPEKISIRLNNGQYVDTTCADLESGIYTIENGGFIRQYDKKEETEQDTSKLEALSNKFAEGIKSNYIREILSEDYDLSAEDKERAIQLMREKYMVLAANGHDEIDNRHFMALFHSTMHMLLNEENEFEKDGINK